MDGIHDMGGMDGFGPVTREADEPVFHADWERRMLAISLAVGFAVPFTDDHLRREIERIPPELYLHSSYYEKWLIAIESLLRERGVLPDGNATLKVETGPAIRPEAVAPAIHAGFPTRRDDAEAAPRFAAGAKVRVRNIHPKTHTRLPRYVRGHEGVVHRDLGVFGLPDSNSEYQGHRAQHCYTVRFSQQALWGRAVPVGDSLYVDLWEDYLEPA
ncbi:MAG TPA: nitrile hydratase subunit beta [Hypericibacter adhaerens]|jgi:nitrile hydratase|uniref:Nitrile hydratase subunit beta n=1 Tax=Hypericibacter adhaerens TaxID=2602016 RepID=A0A5J6N3Q4_9PROT|nr:nitrile hydratase subunit beta [Hypericibacter adhaerens]QEX24127.1 nitrile hydratase [Hypericibacter adhaerens]HWA43058.1 nitrile hydratase subunit beta [Hypericibacter adhaerens]